MTGISITFPGVKALDGVDFRLFPGEVHALMGENGAGKSTLIKALTGVYTIDSGSIVVDGEERTFAGPAQAQAAGISTVYQEVNLCDNLSVAENIMLGHEVRRAGVVDWRRTRSAAREHLRTMNLDIDPKSSLSSHSLAVQQLVAISRAMVVDARVLILDEPTSSLDADEVARLFDVVRALRDRGVAILFVSHFLDQVYEISDRMTVLRNGTLVGEYRTADLDRVELVQKMIGRALAVLEELEEAPKRSVAERADTQPFVQAIGLGRKGTIEPFDLDVYAGEVVGLAGLLGSGRTELARLLYGADHADTGEIRVEGVADEDAHPAHRPGARHRVLLGEPQDRGHRRRPDGAREHRARPPGRPRLAAPHLAAEVRRGRRTATSRRSASAPPTPRRSPATCPAATSRRCCSRAGSPPPRSSCCSTSPRAGSTSAPRPRSRSSSPTWPRRAWPSCSSPPSSTRSCACRHRIAVLRDRRKVAEITNSDDVTTDDVVHLIASGGQS